MAAQTSEERQELRREFSELWKQVNEHSQKVNTLELQSRAAAEHRRMLSKRILSLETGRLSALTALAAALFGMVIGLVVYIWQTLVGK